MKIIMLLLALWIPILVFSQPADKYAAFSAQKKSIVLRTGITMKYLDLSNAQATPVIFLHGSTDTGRSFQPTIEELIKMNSQFRIIVPDLRGHGETSLPDKNQCAGAPENCFTPADFAADIIALMDQKNILRAHLVGHSMGSVIAQELALKYPERVNSLVLIGTFVNGKECRGIHEFIIPQIVEGQLKSAVVKSQKGQWPKEVYNLTPQDLGPEVTKFLKNNWVAEMATEPSYLDAIYQETIRVPIGTWIGMFKALGEIDNRAALENLKIPVLVLYASQDMVISQPDQQQVKASLAKAAKKHGTKFIYKTYGKTPLPASGMQENDLGHNLQWAAPKQVAADVVAFINSGFPVENLPYINPENTNQVITEESQSKIISFHQEEKN